MGQAISRRVMPRISKAIESHESVMTKDALDDIARKRAQAAASNSKYIDPSAMQGFKRDQWSPSETLHSEKMQNEFLRSSSATAAAGGSTATSPLSSSSSSSHQEMPQDLIKFLNDAGPLQKKVDKELTSPKVYESLLNEQEQLRQQQQQSRQRRRRMMPMVGNSNSNSNSSESLTTSDSDLEGDNEHPMDGTMVSRTTNFSTKKTDEGRAGIRLTENEIFRLLLESQTKKNTTILESLDLPPRFSNVEDDNGNNNSFTDEEKEEYKELVSNMIQHTGVPVLMQDTDKSFVGAWNDKVEDLKLAGVRLVKEGVVELHMQHDVDAMSKLKDGGFKNTVL